MYRPLLILLVVVSAIHGSVSQQVQMQDHDGPFSLTDSSAQLEELQKNISSLWSYIHELRGAVTHHLNHLRQHQIEMEDSIHRLEHHSQGDSHAAHTAGHSHSGEDHAHGSSSQHSHSGEDHAHGSSSQHSHSGEDHHHYHHIADHHHSGENHPHDDHSHSHSGEHQSHGHYHDSHSHTDGDHAHGDDHSHGHAHKDSHENADDLQQTAQVSEPLIEPVIVASTRPPSNHHTHHHHSYSRGGAINLMGEDSFHGASRSSRNRTVAMPKYSDYHLYEFAVCNVAPNQALSIEQQQNIVGQVSFWQKKTGGPLNIHVRLSGFSMGDHHAHHQQAQQQEEDSNDTDMPPMVHKHGFHIHALADIANGCQGAGPHYNPKGVTHGGPKSLVRHVGDLGNIECDDHGIANLAFSDGIASLKGPYSVVGKSIVVHAGQDDLGLGGDDESLKTGNAGARLACCVIQKVDKLPFRSYKAMKTAIQHQN